MMIKRQLTATLTGILAGNMILSATQTTATEARPEKAYDRYIEHVKTSFRQICEMKRFV